jgi:hypothetical protein
VSRKQKKPIHIINPSEQKIPRGGHKVDQITREQVAWHVRIIDRAGPWGWNNANKRETWDNILEKMSIFETMMWAEIERNGSHDISLSDLCSEARKRLTRIKQDDVDEIFSLRLTGKQRIWGIRDRNILKIIWWDPDHSVCPSGKKHT